MVARKWVDNVIGVVRVSERVMVVRVTVGKVILCVVSVYGPQLGRLMEEKEGFYVELGGVVDGIGEQEVVIVCGDLNGHVGEDAEGYEEVHGGKGFGVRNVEGEMVLEFAVARELIVVNTWFEKEESRKVSYDSGGE